MQVRAPRGAMRGRDERARLRPLAAGGMKNLYQWGRPPRPLDAPPVMCQAKISAPQRRTVPTRRRTSGMVTSSAQAYKSPSAQRASARVSAR